MIRAYIRTTHVTRLDVASPNTTTDAWQYRPVCLCNWRGDWHGSHQLAGNEGAQHVAAAYAEGEQ